MNVIFYTFLLAVATWQWQQTSDQVSECRFNQIKSLGFEQQVQIVQQLSEIQSSIYPILEKNTEISTRDAEASTDKLDAESAQVLQNEKKIDEQVDKACGRIGEIGWSFLAISLIAAGVISILTAQDVERRRADRPKTLDKRRVKWIKLQGPQNDSKP